jgi:galactokinase
LSETRVPVIGAEQFAALFGIAPVVVSSAHGRVNLIGEHTDYNGGFVLPTLIPQATTAALAPSSGRRVRVWSRELSEDSSLREFHLGDEQAGQGWLDYVQGVTVALRTGGFDLGGFDLALASDVPLGSGLSSSAALEVSVLRALRRLFGLDFDDVALAKLGRAVETDFVGAPIGIMDQMASSLAVVGEALFVDTRTLQTEPVALPPAAELVVINSGVAHHHAHGDYRTRRAECEHAASLLGVAELRDVGVGDLTRLQALPAPLDRRVRHVVTENQRVLDAVAAMRAGDAAALGALFDASHASQRDDYECSVPEVDQLVAIAQADPAVFGARLTGGGFGGSIVGLVRGGEGAAVAARVADQYSGRSGRAATVLVPEVPGTVKGPQLS